LHRAEPCVAAGRLPAVGDLADWLLRGVYGGEPAVDRAASHSLDGAADGGAGDCGGTATAAAFSIQSWAQTVLPPTHTALLLTLEPVFAWITSFVFMGERLGVRPAVGAVLILGGIALTELVPQPLAATAHEAG